MGSKYANLQGREWTNEELAKLEAKYPTTDLEELSKELDRTVRALIAKANVIGVVRQRNNKIVNGKKFCSMCQKWHPISEFYRNKAKLDGYEYYCKKYYKRKNKKIDDVVVHKDKYKFTCATEYIGVNRERIVHEKREILIFDGIEGKICNCCKEWIPLIEFSEQEGGAGGRTSRCKACHNIEYRHQNKDIEYALRAERMRLRKEEPTLEEKQVQSKAKKIVKAMPELQKAFKAQKEAKEKAKAEAKAKAKKEAELENKEEENE